MNRLFSRPLAVCAIFLWFMGDVSWALDGFTVEQGSFVQETDGSFTVSGDTAVSGSFNIAEGESIVFNGLSDAQLIWRDQSGSVSQIAGDLTLNSLIFALINTNGINILSTGQITANDASLILSTLNISNQDFFNQNYQFSSNGSFSQIVNKGLVEVDQLVAFISNAIRNDGAVLARMGQVVFAAGDEVSLSVDNEGLISVIVDEEYAGFISEEYGELDQILNTGVISSEGGRILMSADAKQDVFRSAVRNSGEVLARSADDVGGMIVLGSSRGDMVLEEESLLDVSSTQDGLDAGLIDLKAVNITQAGVILADASDNAKAGTMDIIAQEDITLEATSEISAKGKDVQSEGGYIYMYGHGDGQAQDGQVVDMSGGTISGDAGFGEFSATNNVDFAGSAWGDAADGYELGTFIIDPTNATISGSYSGNPTVWATNNVTLTGNASLSGSGTFTILADHNSATPGDWDDNVGAILSSNSTYRITASSGTVRMMAASGVGNSSASFATTADNTVIENSSSGDVYVDIWQTWGSVAVDQNAPTGNVDVDGIISMYLGVDDYYGVSAIDGDVSIVANMQIAGSSNSLVETVNGDIVMLAPDDIIGTNLDLVSTGSGNIYVEVDPTDFASYKGYVQLGDVSTTSGDITILDSWGGNSAWGIILHGNVSTTSGDVSITSIGEGISQSSGDFDVGGTVTFAAEDNLTATLGNTANVVISPRGSANTSITGAPTNSLTINSNSSSNYFDLTGVNIDVGGNLTAIDLGNTDFTFNYGSNINIYDVNMANGNLDIISTGGFVITRNNGGGINTTGSGYVNLDASASGANHIYIRDDIFTNSGDITLIADETVYFDGGTSADEVSTVSGNINITSETGHADVGNVSITGGSGNVNVTAQAGYINVRDNYGGITVSGSGDITLDASAAAASNIYLRDRVISNTGDILIHADDFIDGDTAYYDSTDRIETVSGNIDMTADNSYLHIVQVDITGTGDIGDFTATASNSFIWLIDNGGGILSNGAADITLDAFADTASHVYVYDDIVTTGANISIKADDSVVFNTGNDDVITYGGDITIQGHESNMEIYDIGVEAIFGTNNGNISITNTGGYIQVVNGGGGLYVSGTGDITLDTNTSGANHIYIRDDVITGNGDIHLNSLSAIVFDQAGDTVQTGNGNVLFETQDFYIQVGDVNITNGNFTATAHGVNTEFDNDTITVVNGLGGVNISGSGDITLDTNNNPGGTHIEIDDDLYTASGDILVHADDLILHDVAGDLVSTGNGNITYISDHNYIRIGEVSIGAGSGNFSATSYGSYVNLFEGVGDITHLGTGNVSFVSTAQNVYLRGDITTTGGDIRFTAEDHVYADGHNSQSALIDTNGGHVVIQADSNNDGTGVIDMDTWGTVTTDAGSVNLFMYNGVGNVDLGTVNGELFAQTTGTADLNITGTPGGGYNLDIASASTDLYMDEFDILDPLNLPDITLTNKNFTYTFSGSGNMEVGNISTGTGDISIVLLSGGMDLDSGNSLTSSGGSIVLATGGGTISDNVEVSGTISSGGGDIVLGASGSGGVGIYNDVTSGNGNVSLSGSGVFGPLLGDNKTVDAGTGTIDLHTANGLITTTKLELDAQYIDVVNTTLNGVYINVVQDGTTVTVDQDSTGYVTILASDDLILGDVSYGSGNLTITSTLGSITSGGSGDVISSTGTGDVTITAQDGIDINSDFMIGASVDLTNSVMGNVRIDESDDINISALDMDSTGTVTINAAGDVNLGDIDLTSGGMTVTTTSGDIQILDATGGIIATGASDITLDASVHNYVNDDITSVGGNITLLSDRDFYGYAGDDISSGGGNIIITADHDLDANGQFIMDDNSLIDSGAGTITIFADDDVGIGGLISTNSGNAITVTSERNHIYDLGDTYTDISAVNGRVLLRSDDGIGSGDALEISAAELDAINDSNNGIELSESDTITIVNLDNSSSGITTLTAGGNITLNENAIDQGAGNLILTASDAAILATSATSGLNAEIEAEGNVTLNADEIGSATNAVEISADTADSAATLDIHSTTNSGVDNQDVFIDVLADQFGSVEVELDEAYSEVTIDVNGGMIDINTYNSSYSNVSNVSLSDVDFSFTAAEASLVNSISTGTGNITLNVAGATLIGQGGAVQTTDGDITLNLDGGSSRLSDTVESTGSGDITINGGIVTYDSNIVRTNSGNIDINQGIVLSDGTTVIETTSGNIDIGESGDTLKSDANEFNNLTINVGTGNLQFHNNTDLGVNGADKDTRRIGDLTITGGTAIDLGSDTSDIYVQNLVINNSSLDLTLFNGKVFDATGNVSLTLNSFVATNDSNADILLDGDLSITADDIIVDVDHSAASADGNSTLTINSTADADTEDVVLDVFDDLFSEIVITSTESRSDMDINFTANADLIDINGAIVGSTLDDVDLNLYDIGFSYTLNEQGNVYIQDINLGAVGNFSVIAAQGGINLTDSAGGIVTSAGNITLDAVDFMYLFDDITSAGGDITLLSDGSFNLNPGDDIRSSGGDIVITADHDLDNSGSVTISDTALVDSGAGTITIYADGNVGFGGLVSTNLGNAVTVTSLNGYIYDAGSTYVDIDSSGLVRLSAADGIGSSGALDVDVDSLSLTNTTSGALQISDSDDITIVQIDQDASAAVSITAAGTITVDSSGSPENAIDVSGTATVTLDANGASADIDVYDGIRSVSGLITLLADNDVNFLAAEADVASTSGGITMTADANGDVNGSGGAINLHSGTSINVGSGIIGLAADESLAITGLVTTSTASNAVTVTSTSGSISDGGDSVADVTTPGTLVLSAATGIGSSGALDTDVATLNVTNTTSGNIQIVETDSLALDQLVNSGAGTITLTASGAITDGGDSNTDISATGLVTLSADGGIGSADALEISVSSLNVYNINSGNVQINETDNITLSNLSQSGSGSASLVSGGSIVLSNDAVVVGDGTLTLTATGILTGTDDTTDEIDADGNVILTADQVSAIDLTGDGGGDRSLTLNLTSASGQNSDIDILTDQFSSIVLDNADADSSFDMAYVSNATAIDINGGSDSVLNNIDFNTNNYGVDFSYSLSEASQDLQVEIVDMGAGSLTLDTNGGSILLDASDIDSTSGDITFVDAVSLSSGATAIDLTSGTLNFNSTLDGAQALNLNSGTGSINFDGIVGGSARLGALTIADAGNVVADADISVASFTQTTGSGTTQIDGVLDTSAGNINLANNAITINGTLQTTGSDDIVLNAESTDISLDENAIDSADVVTLTAAGAITAQDAHSGSNAEIEAEGAVTLNADSIGTGSNHMEINADTADGTATLTINSTADADAEDVALDVLGDLFSDLVITADDTRSDIDINFTANGDAIDINGSASSINLNTIDTSNYATNFTFTVDEASQDIVVTFVNTGAANMTLNASGEITDGGDGSVDLISSGTITLTADSGIGSSDSIETSANIVDLSNATSGNIQINETNAITLAEVTQSTAGNINVTAGGTITVDSGGSPVSAVTAVGAGTITLDANGASSDIIFNDGLTSATGTLTLQADRHINFAAAEADITNTSGTVTITADADGTNSGSGGEIIMVDGSVIDAGSALLDIDGDGDIVIDTLQTTGNIAIDMGSVGSSRSLTSVDSNDDADDLIADTITFNNLTGMGNATHRLDIDADEINYGSGAGDVYYDATGVGNQIVRVSTTGDIDIGASAEELHLYAISTSNSDINITNSFNGVGIRLFEDLSTTGSGDIFLQVSGSGADMFIHDPISAENGNVTLSVGDDLLLAAPDADITTTGGNVALSSGVDTTGGVLRMNDGSLINAGSGTIALSTDHDIRIGGLLTTSSSSSAVTLTSTLGNIVDGGSTHADVDAENGGLVIDVVSGIDLDTHVASLDIDNSSGSIDIDEADNLSIVKIAGGSASIDLAVSSGAITDGGDADTDVSTSGTLTLSATTGIGASNAIDTAVGTLSVTNTTSGAMQINESDNVTVSNFTQSGSGAASLVSGADITLNNDSVVISDGTLTLTATGTLTGTDDTTDEIYADGNVVLTADQVSAIDLTGDAGGDRTLTMNLTSASGQNSDIDILTDQFSSIVLDNADADSSFDMAYVSNATAIDINGGSDSVLNNIDFNTNNYGVDFSYSLSEASQDLQVEIVDMGAGSLTLDTNGGSILLDASDIDSTSGDITFVDAVSLSSGATAIDLTSGTLNFNSTLDGAQALNLNSGTGSINFDGIVGGSARLGALTIADAGNVVADSDMSVTSFTQTTGSGTTQIDGVLDTSAGNINLANNAITINGTLQTTGSDDIVLNAESTDISLDENAIDSADAVTLTAAGAITAQDAHSGSNAEIEAEGAVTLNADSIGTGSNHLEIHADTGDGTATLTINSTADADAEDVALDVLGDLFSDLVITADDTRSDIDINFTANGDAIDINGGASSINLNAVDTSTYATNLTFTVDEASQDIVVTSVNTGAANMTLNASGEITDGGDGSVDLISSGTITLTADSGIGSSDSIETSANIVDLTNATSGNIQINETNAITLAEVTQSTAGNINVTAGGTITVDSGGSPANAISAVGTGTITLDANGASSDIIFNDGLTSATGTVDILADGHIQFATAEADITSTSGDLNINARASGLINGTSGEITMVDGSLIDAGSGAIDIDGDGDLVVDTIQTTNSIIIDMGNGVSTRTLTSVDSNDDTDDLIASLVLTNNLTGMGNSTHRLDIDAGEVNYGNGAGDVYYDVTGTGNQDIRVATTGLIDIDGTGSEEMHLHEISTTNSDINITNILNGTGIRLYGDMSTTGSGDIFLESSGGSSAGMNIFDPISTENGNITINVGDDLLIWASDADITTTAGNVIITSGIESSGGVLRMADGSLIDAGSGTIDLSATHDIQLGGLLTTNSSDSAVTLNAGANIHSVSTTHMDVDAANGRLVIDAGTGVAIDTSVASIDLDNSSGTVDLDESDDIAIVKIAAGSANVDLAVTAGAITDGGDADTDVTTSGTLTLSATTGIGASDAIDTAVATLDVTNTTSGAMQINESDNVTVSNFTQSGSGAASLVSGADITLNNDSVVIGDGTLTLTATGTLIGTDDTTDEIDADGNVLLSADQVSAIDLTGDGGGDRTLTINLTSASGQNSDIDILTDQFSSIVLDNADADSSFDMAYVANSSAMDIDGSTNTSAINAIDFNSNNYNVDVSYTLSESAKNISVTSVNTGSGDLSIISTGAISDGGDAATDISTSGNLIFSAALGIGDGNAIETAVNTLDVTNSASGALQINESDNLTVSNFTQSGSGAASLASGGNIVLSNNTVIAGDGTLSLSASGTLTGTDDSTADIDADGDVVLSADQVSSIDLSGDAGGDRTLTMSFTSASGQNSDIDILTDQFSSIVIDNSDTDSSIDMAYVSTGFAIDINGGTSSTINAIDFNTNNENIDMTYILSDGGQDIVVNSINTGSGDVVLITSGAIVDGDDLTRDIISSGNVNLNAASGVGSDDALETSINQLSVNNSASGNIAVVDDGNLALGLIQQSGAGNVSLTANQLSATDDGSADISLSGTLSLTAGFISDLEVSGATSLNLTDSGAGDIDIEELGSSSISEVNLTVQNTSLGNIDLNFFNADSIDINDSHVLSAIDLSQGNRALTYVASLGNITVASVNLGTATANLTASSGAILDDGISSTRLETTGIANFSAQTGIGSTDSIEINVGSLNATNSSSGDIQFSEQDNLTVLDINQVGSGNVVISAAGNMSLADQAITGHVGNIRLTAGGQIEAVNSSTNFEIVHAGNVSLTADAIGASNSLDLGTGILGLESTLEVHSTAQSGENTQIDLLNDLYAQIILQMDDASSDVNIGFTAGSEQIDIDGGDQLLLNNIDLSSGSLDLDFTLNESNQDLALGSVDLGSGNLSIDVLGGGIFENASGDSAVDLIASDISLQALGAIGSSGEGDIEISSDSLSFNTTGLGNVFLSSTGDINVNNSVVANGSASLISESGKILDGGSGVDIEVLSGTLTLQADLGIGTSGNALDTNVQNLSLVSNEQDIFVTEQGSLSGLNVQVNDSRGNVSVDFSSLPDSLNLVGSASAVTVQNSDLSRAVTERLDIDLNDAGKILDVSKLHSKSQIDLKSDGSVYLEELFTTSSSNNALVVTSLNGSILGDLANEHNQSGQFDVSVPNGSSRFVAKNDIGSSAKPLDIRSAQISANSNTSGNVILNVAGDTVLESINTQNGQVTVDSFDDLLINRIDSSGNVLVSTDGSINAAIAENQGVFANGSEVRLINRDRSKGVGLVGLPFRVEADELVLTGGLFGQQTARLQSLSLTSSDVRFLETFSGDAFLDGQLIGPGAFFDTARGELDRLLIHELFGDFRPERNMFFNIDGQIFSQEQMLHFLNINFDVYRDLYQNWHRPQEFRLLPRNDSAWAFDEGGMIRLGQSSEEDDELADDEFIDEALEEEGNHRL